MRYRYLGKHPHNLIIKDVKVVLRRGDMVELPDGVSLRKVGKRLEKSVVKKDEVI